MAKLYFKKIFQRRNLFSLTTKKRDDRVSFELFKGSENYGTQEDAV
ncbi:hypothetical protein [Christiangramia flava]|nr:hypothetical protein [Christiangramia flava]